jgi:hypothetical protein
MSNADNSDDSLRRINFYFTNDTLSFNNNEFEFELPKEVVRHLKFRKEELIRKQEELIRKQEEFEKNLFIGFSIAGILLLGIGAFAIISRKRKKQMPAIIKVFPNPFSDQTRIIYRISNSASGILRLSNINGNLIHEAQITKEESEYKLDLPVLESGIYFVTIYTDSGNSNIVKIVKN